MARSSLSALGPRLLLLVAGWAVPAPATAAFQQVVLEQGPYQLSIDAAGSASSATTELTVTRPTPGSRVHRVLAMVSSAYNQGDPGRTCLSADGVGLTLDQSAYDTNVYTRFDDVTDELAAYLDGLPAGPNALQITDARPRHADDGGGLLVVWEDPTFPNAVVSVSLGTILTGTGASVVIGTEPLDTGAPDFHVDLGVGISYSYSPNDPRQVSSLEVNGVELTSTAGGFDDGEPSNGGLYTLGGDGDGPDQERYDVTALVPDGATSIAVDLRGQTMHDYLVALWVWAPGASLDCSTGSDEDGDEVTDRCDRCPGADDAVDGDGDGWADGCDRCLDGDDGLDGDADGVPDGCDPCPGTDVDGDGAPDACTTLRYLSPKRGPADGGEETRLVGDGFDASCAAWFDGVPAPTTFVSEQALTAVPPAHAEGLVDVRVSCARGEDTLVGGYTFHPGDADDTLAPTLLRLLPNVVATAGGDRVLAEGEGFTFGTTATVDGVTAEVVVLDDAHLAIVTPPHAEGLAAVEVTNPEGLSDRLEGALLYLAPVEVPEVGSDTGHTAVVATPGGGASGCDTTSGRPWAWLAPALLAWRRRRR